MLAELRENSRLPQGTVTLLFTDIEGSTRLWESQPDAMRAALAHHDHLLREIVAGAHGFVFKTVGDAVCAVFAHPRDAVAAAVTAQHALLATQWPTDPPLRVRMAVHTGAVENRDHDYFGAPVNRLARVLSAGHGGQTLLTQITRDLCVDDLPAGVSVKDLGSHRLKDLARPEHIYQLDHPGLRDNFPPLKSLSTHPNNLPGQLTSFVGRAKEIAAIEALVAKTRLVTLTGPGGSGKTRLALQVAAGMLDRFPDGVWLVELASLTDPGLVAQTVLMALDARESHGEAIVQTLVARLHDKRLLLVLDNSEHVLDACASLADTLVRQCPRISILATSREALGINGEQTYHVPPLSLPDRTLVQTPRSLVECESVQLFVDRARLVRADFDLTNENVPALASLCRRLDGIPLAIELAAARVSSLSVPEIEARLDRRFRLLTGGSRAALPRQQTLRALVDWSYNLLTDSERQLLQSLSVFSGGWNLTAAEAIHADETGSGEEVFDLQSSLCDKSLVEVEQKDGVSRYRLLETIRQYAVDRLLESGRMEVMRGRHCDYFLLLAEATEPKLRGAQQAEWLRLLEVEKENLRGALDWSLTDVASGRGLRFSGALYRFWLTRGYLTEGRDWIVRLLEKAGGDDASPELAKTVSVGGDLAQQQGDFVTAWRLHEQAYRMRERAGDMLGMASSLNNLGVVRYGQCDLAGARTFYERSVALSREIDDRWGLAASLFNLAIVAKDELKPGEARSLLEEAYGLAREFGDRAYIANSLLFLATMATEQHDLAAARKWHGESLSIRRELGDRRGVAYSFEALAMLALNSGSPLHAATMCAAANRLRTEIGAPRPPTDEPGYRDIVDRAREAATESAAFDRAWQAGHGMELPDAIEFAEREIIASPETAARS